MVRDRRDTASPLLAIEFDGEDGNGSSNEIFRSAGESASTVVLVLSNLIAICSSYEFLTVPHF